MWGHTSLPKQPKLLTTTDKWAKRQPFKHLLQFCHLSCHNRDGVQSISTISFAAKRGGGTGKGWVGTIESLQIDAIWQNPLRVLPFFPNMGSVATTSASSIFEYVRPKFTRLLTVCTWSVAGVFGLLMWLKEWVSSTHQVRILPNCVYFVAFL